MITAFVLSITFAAAVLLARYGTALPRQRYALQLLAVSAAVAIFVIVRAATGGLTQCNLELSNDNNRPFRQVQR
jgi:hypothetical protein